ncbi:hypothetical protein BKA62DRAFT_433085 [Auriculariales sp. MPI-PUGE-AT-0066]|nr:hypothetical protein BKA62DRAFT_433085 [Auriculariales sp. MPI-PUGE-AT-0066]
MPPLADDFVCLRPSAHPPLPPSIYVLQDVREAPASALLFFLSFSPFRGDLFLRFISHLAMTSSNIPSVLVKRAAQDMSSTYIALGIVFGAIALICLLVTFYLLSRLRRNGRKLDRELAHNVPKEDFAPQFYEKTYQEDYPRPPIAPPSIPADILQQGQGGFAPIPQGHGPIPPSPTPYRPVRRPSSLFDRQRNSHTPRLPAQSFAEQQGHMVNQADDGYMPPVWQAPLPQPPHQQQHNGPIEMHITAPEEAALSNYVVGPPMPQPGRPDSSYSFYSYHAATTAGTEAPPLQVGRSGSLHRSPSMLRQLLADRAAKAGMPLPPPAPPMPALPEPPQQQRPQLTIRRPDTTLMPYDLETSTPGPTPIDVPPSSAVSTATAIIDQRLNNYGNGNGTLMSMKVIAEDDEDPFADARTVQDPHSATRLTLLQPPNPSGQSPPPSPPRRSPPPLTINIPNSNLKGMTSNGVPQPGPSVTTPPLPVRSPDRAKAPKPIKKKPVMKAPPRNPPSYNLATQMPHGEPDLRATVTPNVLAAFAARLRPETRDFNAEPVAIPDVRDDSDFRITMRS